MLKKTLKLLIQKNLLQMTSFREVHSPFSNQPHCGVKKINITFDNQKKQKYIKIGNDSCLQVHEYFALSFLHSSFLHSRTHIWMGGYTLLWVKVNCTLLSLFIIRSFLSLFFALFILSLTIFSGYFLSRSLSFKLFRCWSLSSARYTVPLLSGS